MEEARYWMWASSKSNTASESKYFVPSASSWEEEAFAEDATRPFGAFTWPPRSYSCSFCGREFKSAQALGGHMNVHRKDRAKLRQGSDCIIDPSQSRTFENANQTCTIVYNTDDISTNSKELLASSVLLPIKASTSFSDQGNSNSHDHIKSMVLSTIQDHRKESFYSSHNPSSSDLASVRTLSNLDYSKIEEDYAKKQNSRPHEGDVAKHADLPVSLNLAIGCGNNKMSCYKKRRTDGISLPFFLKESTEDLDLELRLGDQPKVK